MDYLLSWKNSMSSKNEQLKNRVELNSIEEVKKELNSLKKSLMENKGDKEKTVTKLKEINERLQWTELEQNDKNEIWEAFKNLEKDIDEISLKDEIDKIIKSIEIATQKDLASLKSSITWQKNLIWIENRSPEVQEWIEKSSNDLASTVHGASQDKNPIARKIWEWMEYLMS